MATAHPFGLWAKVRYFVVSLSPHATTLGVRGYSPLAKARCIALQANAMEFGVNEFKGLTIKIGTSSRRTYFDC